MWHNTEPPKDRKFDAYVKAWDAQNDRFYCYRIPNVKWSSGSVIDGISPGFCKVWPSKHQLLSDMGVYIIGWMEIPEPPDFVTITTKMY